MGKYLAESSRELLRGQTVYDDYKDSMIKAAKEGRIV